jgi:transposase-like protein
MSDLSRLQWRHVQADVVRCAVRWSLRDAVRDRDVEGRLRARGVRVDQTPVFRWVQYYAPELDQRGQPSLGATHVHTMWMNPPWPR